MPSQDETDIIVKGRELYWSTWGKMRGENLVTGDISYLKAENGRGFERIFAVYIEKNQESRVRQMIALIKASILPDSMLITPNTKPENLAEILSQYGFHIDDSGACMMMYLDDYAETMFDYADFHITQVMEEKQLADWLSIVNEALFGGELVTLAQLNDVLHLSNTAFYLGLLNGIPVTTCMTVANGDASVLELVATLDGYRRRGLASALMNKALTDLRRKGIKTVALNAEPAGISVYKKLGFVEYFKNVVASYDRENAVNQ